MRANQFAGNKLASNRLAGRNQLALFACLLLLLIFLITSCQDQNANAELVGSEPLAIINAEEAGEENAQLATLDAPLSTVTPFPTRPAYEPAELVDYVAQTGDTLPALAIRFNTTVDEILAANPFIPPLYFVSPDWH